ncbi:MAG: hypothetical protein V3T76_04220, partial [candidate division NC10 bacterium]
SPSNPIAVGTVRTDSFGENLYQSADGFRPGIGDHETSPVEHHELPLMAMNGLSSHFAGTSAYPPTGDIRWPMSDIVLISSALPPTADILDEAGNVSS